MGSRLSRSLANPGPVAERQLRSRPNGECPLSQSSTSPLLGFLHKLDVRRPLSVEEREAVLSLPFTIKTLRRHAFIVREGETPRNCCVLISGFAMRHKGTGNGARQIFSIHMAGDAVDLHNSLLSKADHNLQMLSSGDVAFIPVEAIRDLTLSRPGVGQAMWYETLVDAAIFREWTLNVGRRDAHTRTAHMLCEFALRLEAAGLGRAADYELPMTQEELADALALTPIHVNRTLKALAAEGFVTRTVRSIRIVDWHGLATVGDFDSGYLHLSKVA
jgi:CRP-like cAMP-binding protein